MAEAVVSSVLRYIGEAAYQEALFLYGVRDKVEWAQRELQWVSAFLKDADAKQNKDARVKRWVEEVKEVAYMIEDALDRYFVGREEAGKQKESIFTKLRPRALVARHKVGAEIDKIKGRMEEIRKNAEQYGITKLESSIEVSNSNKPVRPIFVPDIDKTEVVGFEDDVHNICSQLLDHNVSRRSVISIVGAGGRGKTTLSSKIYKCDEVKDYFDCRTWVAISQEFRMIDVLKKLLKNLGAGEDGDEEDLIRRLHNSLSNKRYLIVLDDVWSPDVWTQLVVALPDDGNGSRVLITTRKISIAQEADAANKPYELRILTPDESRQLLSKKAFPNQFAKECPHYLLDLLDKFAQKCDGWPLALVVLGGILSTKDPNTWDDWLSKMDWQSEGGKFLDIIGTSYKELPSHLKPCFMYIAAFPEDHRIRATELIQLWIAEGFVQHPDPGSTRTTEDIARGYLEELVQRCMVQVSERSWWSSRIKYCYVHDMLLELATRKAKENNFLLVCSNKSYNAAGPSSSSESDTVALASARRIAIHEFGNTKVAVGSSMGPNVRSLIYFGKHAPDFNKLRMARVIHVESSVIYSLEWSDEAAVQWMKKQLSTMSLRYFRCDICPREMPMSFWNNNKMLKYVNINGDDRCITGPLSSVKLENLVTLRVVSARDKWVVKFPDLPCIRKLVIQIDPEGNIDWDAVANNMRKLKHLESLHVHFVRATFHSLFIGDFPCVPVTPAFKSYGQLHSLLLEGRWPAHDGGRVVKVDSSLFPPHLVKLTLLHSSLGQDPMREVEKLPCLRVLRLLDLSYKGQQLTCSVGGFKQLRQLKLEFVQHMKELKVEEGAMPMLNLLEIIACQRMKELPDLQYLTNLRELKLIGMSGRLISSLKRGENQHKVEHIPSIIIERTRPDSESSTAEKKEE